VDTSRRHQHRYLAWLFVLESLWKLMVVAESTRRLALTITTQFDSECAQFLRLSRSEDRHSGLLNDLTHVAFALRSDRCKPSANTDALQAATSIRSLQLHLAALRCAYLPGSLLGRFHAQSTKKKYNSLLRHRQSVVYGLLLARSK
jgi:hypothetical protein